MATIAVPWLLYFSHKYHINEFPDVCLLDPLFCRPNLVFPISWCPLCDIYPSISWCCPSISWCSLIYQCSSIYLLMFISPAPLPSSPFKSFDVLHHVVMFIHPSLDVYSFISWCCPSTSWCLSDLLLTCFSHLSMPLFDSLNDAVCPSHDTVPLYRLVSLYFFSRIVESPTSYHSL